MSTAFVREYAPTPVDVREVRRYMRAKDDDPTVNETVKSVIKEAESAMAYRVCYMLLDLEIRDTLCDFGAFSVKSHDLAVRLEGCDRAILMCASVGSMLDRMIIKHSRLSPSRALALEAFGTERVEALCDAFCLDMTKEYGRTRPRYSAGYGDLPLETQREIFRVLPCEKLIGVTLGDGCVMSPSKSVTAFIGIASDRCQ